MKRVFATLGAAAVLAGSLAAPAFAQPPYPYPYPYPAPPPAAYPGYYPPGYGACVYHQNGSTFAGALFGGVVGAVAGGGAGAAAGAIIGGGLGAASNSCDYWHDYYGYSPYDYARYGYRYPPPYPYPAAGGYYPPPVSYPVGPAAYPTPPAPVYRGYYTGYGPPAIDCWPDDSC